MIKTLINGIVYRAKGAYGRINKSFYAQPKVLGTKESLQLLLNEKCSVARFGDGEFNIIRGGGLGFQCADAELAERLKEVLHKNTDGLKIGIPDVFDDLSEYEDKSAKFWNAYLGMHRGELVHLIDMDRTYLNTNMTRFWSGYKNKENTSEIIDLYKKIWEKRDIVFVEGKLTRIGVGNGLFSDANSIHRILCPAKDAWSRYDQILSTILDMKLSRDTLFILALGPTATVLAYDLTRMGYQALDLGHLDIQYEYSLRNATDKIAIEGKYVNENVAGRNVSDSIIDDTYQNSILAVID